MEQEINQEIYAELLSFGFSESAIKRALQITQNKDEAINLILQFQEEEQQAPQEQQEQFVPQGMDLQNANLLGGLDPQQLLNLAQEGVQFQQQAPEKQYKMIFMVRQDLKMGVGKIAAQVGHATLGAYQRMLQRTEQEDNEQGKYTVALETWEQYGQPKIVVKVDTEKEFLDLEKKARDQGINTYIVQDAGRTQVEPGSMTVCAVGPGVIEEIDAITKHLKLL